MIELIKDDDFFSIIASNIFFSARFPSAFLSYQTHFWLIALIHNKFRIYKLWSTAKSFPNMTTINNMIYDLV